MGPDEFHTAPPGKSPEEASGIANNAYTNMMAAWILARSADILDLGQKSIRTFTASLEAFFQESIPMAREAFEMVLGLESICQDLLLGYLDALGVELDTDLATDTIYALVRGEDDESVSA